MSVMLETLREYLEKSDYSQAFFPIVLVSLAVGIIFGFRNPRLAVQETFLDAQPWAGVRQEWFARTKASLRTLDGLHGMLDESYKLFSKKGQAFILPALLDAPWVVLPPASIRGLLSKSDKELDANIIHEQELQVGHTQGSLGLHAINVPIQFEVLRKHVNRRLPLLVGQMHEELDQSFKQYWNTDAHTTADVNVSATCSKIITRVANRVFAGEEICRDERFLKHARLHADACAFGSLLIRPLPRFLRPLLAPLIMYRNRKNLAICSAVCTPVVEHRLRCTAERRANASCGGQAPDDALQWLIDECFDQNNMKELDPQLITHRILMLNFVAIETTAMSTVHTILDLYGCVNSQQLVASLRQECDSALEAHGNKWTKPVLDDLRHMDSTIRESMRFSGIGHIQLPRMVVNPEGTDFKIEDEAFSKTLHVPYGVRVCMPAYTIHHDKAFYPSPGVYDAFRFSTSSSDNGSRERALSITTTTDSFLVFGHGRHACPARFFAAQVMKLLLAYVVQNYEVERVTGGPKNRVLVGAVLVDPKQTVRVTKRERVR